MKLIPTNNIYLRSKIVLVLLLITLLPFMLLGFLIEMVAEGLNEGKQLYRDFIQWASYK